MKKPDLFQYSDYRQFLKDYAAQKHAERKTWSYGAWARALKLSSPSTLTMILNGQRHPGPKLVSAFIKHFEFNDKQAAFFRDLVALQKKVGNDPRLAVFFMKNFRDETAPQLKDALFERAAYVLREMTLLEDFQEKVEWIRSRMIEPLTDSELLSLLSRMQEVGLLGRNDAGKLIPTQVTHKSPPAPEKIKSLHKDILRATEHAVENAPADQRVFTTSFLSIRANNLEEVKKAISEFQDRFSDLFEEKPGKDIYQLNIHFFPATGQTKR